MKCPRYRHNSGGLATCQGTAESVRHTVLKVDRQLGVDDAPILASARPFFCDVHHSQV